MQEASLASFPGSTLVTFEVTSNDNTCPACKIKDQRSKVKYEMRVYKMGESLGMRLRHHNVYYNVFLSPPPPPPPPPIDT